MQIEVYRMDTAEDSLIITLEAICDTFSSLLWDIEYYKCSSFEVYIAANPQNVDIFQPGRIVGRDDDSQHFGIIESVLINTDVENGDYLTVRGRFLMCLLERRIINPMYSTTVEKAYSEIIREVVMQNALINDNRRIPGLSLGTVSGTCWEHTTTLQISYANMKGIDVSVHNGNIDWNKVKNAGIAFAILRAGYGRLEKQKDEKFEQNYAEAKASGIPIGAYWYSYAMTPEEAELEADVFLKVIKGKQFEFPVYFDLEEKKQFDLGKEKVSAIMRAFLEKVEKAGYFVGLYGSASSLTTHTADDIKSHYTIWLAHWVDKTNYGGAYAVWQYSEKGKVDGISGNVDLDICYKDFPTIIKGKGLNGWGKAANPTPVPDPEPTADSKTATVTVQIGNET